MSLGLPAPGWNGLRQQGSVVNASDFDVLTLLVFSAIRFADGFLFRCVLESAITSRSLEKFECGVRSRNECDPLKDMSDPRDEVPTLEQFGDVDLD